MNFHSCREEASEGCGGDSLFPRCSWLGKSFEEDVLGRSSFPIMFKTELTGKQQSVGGLQLPSSPQPICTYPASLGGCFRE